LDSSDITARVTAKIEVPRKSATRVTGVIEFRINGGYGIVSWIEGPRLRILVNAEGDGIDGERGLPSSWKRARHTATRRGRGNESIDSLLGYRENTEGKGAGRGQKRQKRQMIGGATEDVTWDSIVVPRLTK